MIGCWVSAGEVIVVGVVVVVDGVVIGGGVGINGVVADVGVEVGVVDSLAASIIPRGRPFLVGMYLVRRILMVSGSNGDSRNLRRLARCEVMR